MSLMIREAFGVACLFLAVYTLGGITASTCFTQV